MNLLRFSLAVALGLSGSLCSAAAAESCSALVGYKAPGSDMEITHAVSIPASRAGSPGHEGALPAYCRVDGVMEKRVGAGGKLYQIAFAVGLPEQWNGRFMFQGGGGLNGILHAPLGNNTGGTPAIAQGFAVATTDSGHRASGPFDGSFLADQLATLNFLYEANAKVTVVAKQIVAHYYGNPAKHSYFVGCSTGGREGMMMSQRFPTYFDGIVSGAPAIRTNFSNLALRWFATQMNAIAPKDSQGRPQASQALSDGDRKLVIDGIVKACDAKDGLADGLIFNTAACDFDPTTLICKGAKSESCLSAEQANAIKRGIAGPRDSTGRQVYPRFLYDTGLAAKEGIPGLLLAAPSPAGPVASTDMNVTEAAAAAMNARAAVGDTNLWTQLNTFSGRGGKLLFYHGVSDPWFSAQETVDYYERLGVDNGGAQAVRQWSRLFLVPGMAHCGGGAALDRFDTLGAIVEWVERGKAPDMMMATGRAFPNRSRPLCPYPQYAHYSGKGDPEDLKSFACRE